jgi:mono/diheme cytochrome c family protein
MTFVSRPYRATTALLLCILIFSAAGAQSENQIPEPGLALGKEVFIERSVPQCALCHALADAGSTGNVGPKLDELKPTKEQVMVAVREGVEAMPAYGETLTGEEIEAVADYVASVAGRQ